MAFDPTSATSASSWSSSATGGSSTSAGEPSSAAGGASIRIDPLRGPDALSNAISRHWRPYRFRAYALGVLAGLLIGGVATPFGTLLVALVLVVTTSLPALTVPWQEVVWTAVFVIVFARVGSWAIARWLPRDFRAATESYLWLPSARRHIGERCSASRSREPRRHSERSSPRHR
jgi:hypothetical protein